MMPTGPGRYDDLCLAAMAAAGAHTAMLVIVGGVRGEGFSLNSTDRAAVHRLPAALRAIADSIEADLKKTTS